MPATSLTLNFDAVLSTTLMNWSKTLYDTVSKSNFFLYRLMKQQDGGWVTLEDIGERAAVPLMYELGGADSYSGYDVLDTTPTDGITSAFYDWRQASIPIAISGLEERKNAGEERIVALLEAKTKQAELGIQDFLNKSLLQGAGGSSITTAYTSPTNGSQFMDPLPLQVKFDPTSSTTIGGVNQAPNTWWRNQFLNDASSNYAGFLKALRKLRNDCTKGPGGNPNLHLTDQHSYEYFIAALAAYHHNTSYQKADIPFDNVVFFGDPVTWDEYTPDVSGGSVTQSTTSGTWWMLNTDFWKIKVDATRNFAATPFIKPENQDARVATVLFLGAACCMNRRKQGVMGSIDTTPTS